MKPKSQYGCVELKANTLQIIWLKHTGFLDRIASKYRIMICYADNKVLFTSGNRIYCEEAQAEVDSILKQEFTMQLHIYQSDIELKAFIRVFSNQDYRNFCQQNKGFWIYNRHSLMKHLEKMQKEVDYKGILPQLPEHFIIIWMPILNINQIKNKVDDLIGSQVINWNNGERPKQIQITHLEAISIFLILDIESIELEEMVNFNLIQNYEQFHISIKGVFVERAFSVLQTHLTKRFFSPYFYIGDPLSSWTLDLLQNELNQQVKWQSNWKLFSQEEIQREAQKLDRLFGTHLFDFTDKKSNEQIFIFGDKEKQKEISDKITLLIRNMNWVGSQSVTQNYSYQSTNLTSKTMSQSIFQEYEFPVSKATSDSKQTDQPFKNTFQIEQQSNQFNYNYQYNIYEDNFSQQQQIPLRNYKYQELDQYNNNMEQQAPLRGYKGKVSQPILEDKFQNIPYRRQGTNKRKQQQPQFQYIPKQEYDIPEYNYQYKEQEEEKISQLIQISSLTKVFERTIVKLTPQLYQINYSSKKKHFDMQIYKQSFPQFLKSINEQVTTSFSKEQLSISLEVQQNEVKLFADKCNQFFQNIKYFVAQFTSTCKQFLEVLSLRYEVESFQTNTDTFGYITDEQYQQLSNITDGKNIAIKVTYTYHDQGQFEMDFQNFQTGLAFQQESSILEVSTSSVNTKLVMVLPQQQLDYIQSNYPEVEAQKLSKQGKYIENDFYYVQMENKVDKIQDIKQQLIQKNNELVNTYITYKKEKYKGQKLIKISQQQNSCFWKVQLYRNILYFYTKFLNDQIEQQCTLEEYQNKSKQIPFTDITIDIGNNRIQTDKDFTILEKVIFCEDSKYKISTAKVIELPRGNFLALIVRNNIINGLKHISELDSENSLIRGYIENH